SISSSRRSGDNLCKATARSPNSGSYGTTSNNTSNPHDRTISTNVSTDGATTPCSYRAITVLSFREPSPNSSSPNPPPTPRTPPPRHNPRLPAVSHRTQPP